LLGFALILFMLLRVSGVSLTEETITERRPEYADYIRTTSAFIPRRAVRS
jgi:steroid 5-alpha reductase family enzyme